KITENEVVVLLTYPINATLAGKSAELTQYYTKIPLDFREFYGLANAIMYAEINTSFLESVAKQVIGIYGSGADSSRLPPVFAREESYVPKFWSRTVVENSMRSLLTSHVPLLTLNRTKNARQIVSPDPMVNGLYKTFYQGSVLNKSYGNFSVNFYYLGWPIYFYVGPGRGELLSATRVMDIQMGIGPIVLFPSPPVREYAFFYDISYPVIVELRRDSDLFGEGYSFFFALESNLRNNLDIRQWMSGYGTYGSNIVDYFTWVSAFETELPETTKEAQQTIEESINATKREGKSLFCNPDQRLSGNMTFLAVDKFTGKELDGVSVKFGCGMYDLCTMGVTGFVLEENRSALTSKLPLCFGGGTLKFAKTGYVDEVVIDLTVNQGTKGEFKVEMSQIIEKNVTIVKQLVNRAVLYWSPYENHGRDYAKRLVLSPLVLPPAPENDSIIVTIRKVDVNPLVNFQSQLVSLDSTMNSTKIKLAPGVYEVKGTFIGLKGANITPSLRCKTQDDYNTYVSSEEGDCYYLPDKGTVLQQTIAGGIDLNNDTGYWVVDSSDLLSDNSIQLTVLELPKLVLIEDLNEMGLVSNLTQEYRSQLEPVFVSN
ncbi:hypothetical protein HZB90_03145, partial [archaeon]|nr:hypothetical protein [archaeon]